MSDPEKFDPKNLSHWVNVLHNAAAVKRGAPNYDDAQAVVNLALLQIQHLNRAAQAADPDQIAAGQPGAQVNPGATLIGGLAHGASLGLGEPIAGLASAIRGKGFRAGAQQYREGLENLEAANPNLAAASEIGGGLALPGATIGTIASRIGATVPVGVTSARIAAGGIAGAVPGAVAGFSSGGEDPGDFGARARAAGLGAGAGAVLGGGITALSGRVSQQAADLADREVQREINRERLARLRERRVSLPRTGPGTAQGLADQFGVPVERITAPRDQLPRDLPKNLYQRRSSPRPGTPLGIARDIADMATRERPAVLANLDAPSRPSLVEPRVSAAGRFTRKGSRMATRQLTPDQERALQTLVTQNLLGTQTSRPFNRPRPQHPLFAGTRSYTRSPEVRGGERLTPSAQGSIVDQLNGIDPETLTPQSIDILERMAGEGDYETQVAIQQLLQRALGSR